MPEPKASYHALVIRKVNTLATLYWLLLALYYYCALLLLLYYCANVLLLCTIVLLCVLYNIVLLYHYYIITKPLLYYCTIILYLLRVYLQVAAAQQVWRLRFGAVIAVRAVTGKTSVR
jgi:cellulose synthase/poly-beta-1,6-N-acetylglucosamine synthase-like glycosyltransferase